MEYLGRTDFVQSKPADGIEHGLVQSNEERERRNQELRDRLREFEDSIGSTSNAATEAARNRLESVLGAEPEARPTGARDQLSEHLGALMGDAPFCDICGHITVRNATCYKCLNCGQSLGCS